MDKTLEQLEEEYRLLRLESNELLKRIQVIESREKIPALKTAYEGKFFKHHNSDYNERHFFSYYFCKKITIRGSAIMDTFETNSEKECSFRTYEDDYVDLSYFEEITKTEYELALRSFTCHLMEFGDVILNIE